jgi:uncharacterized protein
MNGFRKLHLTVSRLLLAVFFAISASAALAERVEDLPQPTDYVSDLAHVLSPEAVARLDRICGQLDHSQAKTQIAVVTIKTLDGVDSAEFTNALEDKWKMGRKGSDYRGVLILLAVNDHKRRIDVGYGLEGILPDGLVGDIGREMVPDLRANDFDGAVTLAVGRVAQIVATDAKITLEDAPAADPSRPVPSRPMQHGPTLGKLILLIFILVFFGGFSLFRFLIGLGLFGGISRWGGGPRIGGGGFGGGGGGGDSGGSSFGGFGGDGGGFGGGGAGGDW